MQKDDSELGAQRVTRREFIVGAATAAAAVGATLILPRGAAAAPIELPQLPWADAALAPYISASTIGFHYGKHHKGYVDTLNKLIAGSALADLPLEKIMTTTAGKPDQRTIFNNAAQVWNHTFYWKSMRPKGGGPPPRDLAAKIDKAYGGYDAFKKAFTDAGLTRFGSGWVWLVARADGSIAIESTPNADNPLAGNDPATATAKPLLTMDVWEHAYYLDYQNRRGDYVTAFLDHLVNWDFAAANLAA
ncbi:MAG: superoxide dismutase [Polyangiaceae bacterium UTPRO1]|jgi:Fe-Mn family superoxide dismutase|nr:superoxide dismutase [Myxococcales bacterium]OQY67239.1 MAG: superoxide dismutase [Polyangiaceae bacterium UTPRO1]